MLLMAQQISSLTPAMCKKVAHAVVKSKFSHIIYFYKDALQIMSKLINCTVMSWGKTLDLAMSGG